MIFLSAEHVKFVREFAKEHKIKHYFEGGNVGVEHAILPEKGIAGHSWRNRSSKRYRQCCY
jgi:homoaconitase/3-isopropylmalate dehydratase large subunit